ncbi:hypothetical protein ACC725_38080, partial [Rhizobium ruizarguesonis]
EGDPPLVDAAEQTALEKADESLNALQHEVMLLNARIGVLREDAEAALKAKATSVKGGSPSTISSSGSGGRPWRLMDDGMDVSSNK